MHRKRFAGRFRESRRCLRECGLQLDDPLLCGSIPNRVRSRPGHTETVGMSPVQHGRTIDEVRLFIPADLRGSTPQ